MEYDAATGKIGGRGDKSRDSTLDNLTIRARGNIGIGNDSEHATQEAVEVNDDQRDAILNIIREGGSDDEE